MHRLRWPQFGLVLSLHCTLQVGHAAEEAQRYNVLFIAADDLRVELGCYGDSIVQSPNIDRLAERGTQFEHAYCAQAVCNPSRASLLTGLRPDTLGVWDLPTHFREKHPDIVTLPQLFKQYGYHARNIGKVFHNWRQDDYKGDPKSWSVLAEMHYAPHGSDKPKLARSTAERSTTVSVPADLSRVPRTEMRDVPDEAYFDGRIATKSITALRELKDQPFFLAVGFWKPHAPFNAPKKYWDLYSRSDIPPPTNPLPPENVPALAMHDSREILRGFADRPGGRPTPEEVISLRHAYFAATSYMDAQLGRVIDELDRLGLRDNTIIVFWSDHGFHLGEHSLWAKTSNFELDARVPLIIDAPGFNEGQRAKGVVELLDLYPTLADLCGLTAPDDLEGVTLRPALKDPLATVKPGALTQHTRPAYPSESDPLQAVGYSLRTARYRYTEWRDVKSREVLARELYDHSEDPHETRNTAGRPGHIATMKRLSAQLQTLE